jgi:hypothetical protein
MKEFNRQNLSGLRDEIQACLNDVAKRNGITITLGTARFSPGEYRAKVTATTEAPVDATTKERKEFEEYAGAFFLRPDDFGKTFAHPHGGGNVTIVGIKPRSRKYPIIVRTERGARYKFPASSILRALGRHAEAKKTENLERGESYGGD